ncbi:hypothetical protein HPB47_017387 [Ixodes persulcatus]|uniref:Uncharacterized protein n=1 Tax=Ixodes persulcatus TaxID=34615 RepID=A0AC60QNM3_IXOPE|nr:hypothetical protein HPB47_017387 [Ixodes persulcatus]
MRVSGRVRAVSPAGADTGAAASPAGRSPPPSAAGGGSLRGPARSPDSGTRGRRSSLASRRSLLAALQAHHRESALEQQSPSPGSDRRVSDPGPADIAKGKEPKESDSTSCLPPDTFTEPVEEQDQDGDRDLRVALWILGSFGAPDAAEAMAASGRRRSRETRSSTQDRRKRSGNSRDRRKHRSPSREHSGSKSHRRSRSRLQDGKTLAVGVVWCYRAADASGAMHAPPRAAVGALARSGSGGTRLCRALASNRGQRPAQICVFCLSGLGRETSFRPQGKIFEPTAFRSASPLDRAGAPFLSASNGFVQRARARKSAGYRLYRTLSKRAGAERASLAT